MYAFSNPGYEPNNLLFSPCSRRLIFAVLYSKSSRCFKTPSDHICGNQLVESSEQCDAGMNGDVCCAPDCRLKPVANCSWFNDLCCTQNCKPQSQGHECRAAESADCKASARCDVTFLITFETYSFIPCTYHRYLTLHDPDRVEFNSAIIYLNLK